MVKVIDKTFFLNPNYQISLIVAAIAFAYCNVATAPFLHDDIPALVNNPDVQVMLAQLLSTLDERYIYCCMKLGKYWHLAKMSKNQGFSILVAALNFRLNRYLIVIRVLFRKKM